MSENNSSSAQGSFAPIMSPSGGFPRDSAIFHSLLSAKHTFSEPVSKRSRGIRTLKEILTDKVKKATHFEDCGYSFDDMMTATNPGGRVTKEFTGDADETPVEGFASAFDFFQGFIRLDDGHENLIKKGRSTVNECTFEFSQDVRLIDKEKYPEMLSDLYALGFIPSMVRPRNRYYNNIFVILSELNLTKHYIDISLEDEDVNKSIRLNIHLSDDPIVQEGVKAILLKYTEMSMPEGQIDTITGISQAGLEIKSEKVQLDQTLLSPVEFYPWMNGTSIQDYFSGYLEDKANVMLFMGPPGTGKSSMIRTAVAKLGLKILFCSSMAVASDPSFVAKLGEKVGSESSDYDMIVIEDADVLIRPRSQGNVALSEILNSTSGMTSKGNYKLLVTTNQVTTENIDEALLRPGRCYDVMEFGYLDNDEANAAREAIKLNPLRFKSKERTLAEALTAHVTATERSGENSNSGIMSPRFPLKKRL